MQIDHKAPIETILTVIGKNLEIKRIRGNKEKKEIARLTGLNRNTVSAALRGEDIRISTLIRISRVLQSSDWLIPLLTEPMPSPLEILSKSRKRRSKMEKEIIQTPKPQVMGIQKKKR